MLSRYKKQPDGVRMVHYHFGTEYRGVSVWEWWFKFRNPRYGQGYNELVKDPSSLYGKNKNKYTTRVRSRRTYVKPLSEEAWVKLISPDTASNNSTKKTDKESDSKKKNSNKKSKKAADSESSAE